MMMMSERIKTDRREKMCPYDIVNIPEIFASPFVYETLAFTIERQKEKLQVVSDSLISSAEDSPEQFQHLRQLCLLILYDARLGDYLNSQVLSLLVHFLDDKKDPDFQHDSATIIENIVSSKKGSEVKDILIPYLLNLISSSNRLVQQQALNTLKEIATVYPNSCNAMIKNKALDLLESVLTNEYNHYQLLQSGAGLLVAFCQMSPHLLSDKMQKVVGMICTAIEYKFSASVLVEVCLALAILSDQGFVKIGTAVTRLLDLIDYPGYYVVLSSLRTIGNYVRWGNDEDIQFMVERALLLRLEKLLCNKYTIVRKEACWIISNITAVANNSRIQEVIDMGLIDTLVRLVRIDEFEVKEVAAHAISNVVIGSDKKQFTYLKEKCFPLLDDLRFFYCRDNQRVVTLCSEILQLGNIRASMTSTADLASVSAECGQRFQKITKKRNSRRCKKLSTVAREI